jgi:hypothetical protein
LVDLESKLTNIIGLLSRSSAPFGGVQAPVDAEFGLSANPEIFSDSPHPTAEWMSQGYLDNAQLDEGLTLSEKSNAAEDSLQSPRNSSTATDTAWITDLGLSPVVIGHFLDRFRSMGSYFPFVRLSDAWTAASMAEDRPFLLLAAAAVASSNHCHLQDALIKQFKESLTQRVLIAGEQDLDLLQGLLVYLAW